MKILVPGMLALAGLCSCASDGLPEGGGAPGSAGGKAAYLAVRINDVNSSTRATSDGYRDASAEEYDVRDARFFFYDGNGTFVAHAGAWDGIGEDGSGNASSVQVGSVTVVALRGLAGAAFPRYMVTVLNEPDGFESADGWAYGPAATLDEMQAKLAHGSIGSFSEGMSFNGNAGIWLDGTDAGSPCFVLSTTSYLAGEAGDGDEHDRWPFATVIGEECFHEEPIADDLSTVDPVVDVHVERLAAKVELAVGDDLASGAVAFVGDDGTSHALHPLPEAVEGGDGAEESAYVEFLGWRLNGTARCSNIVKEIDPGWTNDEAGLGAGWNWNDAADWRSFWGKSFNYGVEHAYPATSARSGGDYAGGKAGNYDGDEAGADPSLWLDPYLRYTSLLEPNDVGIGNCEYCAENTNDAGILGDRLSTGITNALVKARCWASADGEDFSAGDLVRLDGRLYTREGFEDHLVNFAAPSAGVPISRLYVAYVGDGETVSDGLVGESNARTLDELCEELGVSSVDTVSRDLTFGYATVGDGRLLVSCSVATDGRDGGRPYYLVRAEGDGDAEDGLYYLESTEADRSYVLAAFGEFLDGLNLAADMNGYRDGLMYYSIPIEHLNDAYAEDGTLAEANYGVVRNHWYRLTVNGVGNAGVGIWDEEEVIVPTERRSFLAAGTSVLLWKLFEQTVLF